MHNLACNGGLPDTLIQCCLVGFEDQNNVFPIYIGDDRTDEDAFKVGVDFEVSCLIMFSH